MDHVGWKVNATAHHYIKLRQVLAYGGANKTLSRLPSALTENYRHRNDLFLHKPSRVLDYLTSHRPPHYRTGEDLLVWGFVKVGVCLVVFEEYVIAL